VLTTPGLALTKTCPATNGLPGGVLGFTGTITNTGNVTVTNVVVVNNQPANNTPVITIPRLDPGEGRSFSGSYAIPFNACSVSDTLTATGTDLCGHSTNATISATCPVLTTPGLTFTDLSGDQCAARWCAGFYRNGATPAMSR
jgi:uncharacterized repeat protein (TIGR01451 family)